MPIVVMTDTAPQMSSTTRTIVSVGRMCLFIVFGRGIGTGAIVLALGVSDSVFWAIIPRSITREQKEQSRRKSASR